MNQKAIKRPKTDLLIQDITNTECLWHISTLQLLHPAEGSVVRIFWSQFLVPPAPTYPEHCSYAVNLSCQAIFNSAQLPDPVQSTGIHRGAPAPTGRRAGRQEFEAGKHCQKGLITAAFNLPWQSRALEQPQRHLQRALSANPGPKIPTAPRRSLGLSKNHLSGEGLFPTPTEGLHTGKPKGRRGQSWQEQQLQSVTAPNPSTQ